jgi:hypothetical protein
MTKTLIIGDAHGKWQNYIDLVGQSGVSRTVQIGDFGVGFGGGNSANEARLTQWMTENPTNRFIRGNHDGPEACRNMPGYIDDGMVENDVMFIGGAWSIDGPGCPWDAHRLPGHDWWYDEECSDSAFDTCQDIYAATKPRVMITHDCPSTVSKRMFFDTGILGGDIYKTRTGEALQRMLDIHRPELWIFGHWHNSTQLDMDGTKFVCLAELDTMIVDL